MPTIGRSNPKGQDICVSDDGHTYGNDAFTLHFQDGPIANYGVRNGCFEEEILAVLIDRAGRTGNVNLVVKLGAALAELLGNPEPATGPDPKVSKVAPKVTGDMADKVSDSLAQK